MQLQADVSPHELQQAFPRSHGMTHVPCEMRTGSAESSLGHMSV